MNTKAIIIAIALLAGIFAQGQTGNAFSTNDKEITEAFKQLNEYRRRAGLKPVVISSELSKACYMHSVYCVKNSGNRATAGLGGHYEIDTLPYATKEGKNAGLKSCIAYVRPTAAIPQLMNTFYHRMPLLDPNTTAVGIGYYSENYRTVCCVDMRSAYKWNNDTATRVVVFPDEGGFDIPVSFQHELPNPVPDSIYSPGYPITIQFFRERTIKDIKVKLTDNSGMAIDCILSTPDKPLTSFPQWNTVCIIPKQRLQYTKTYTVDFSCSMDGKAYRKKWDFYTVFKIG